MNSDKNFDPGQTNYMESLLAQPRQAQPAQPQQPVGQVSASPVAGLYQQQPLPYQAPVPVNGSMGGMGSVLAGGTAPQSVSPLAQSLAAAQSSNAKSPSAPIYGQYGLSSAGY